MTTAQYKITATGQRPWTACATWTTRPITPCARSGMTTHRWRILSHNDEDRNGIREEGQDVDHHRERPWGISQAGEEAREAKEMTVQPWRKVVGFGDMPLTWVLRLECGHAAYRAGSVVEQSLPKKVRCRHCAPVEPGRDDKRA